MYTFSRMQLAGLALAALLIGMGGQVGMKMFQRHNEQHWNVEEFIRGQKALNDQLIAAINQLGAGARK